MILPINCMLTHFQGSIIMRSLVKISLKQRKRRYKLLVRKLIQCIYLILHRNSVIFQKNPLQNDFRIKKHIEQKERARIEKKICEIQKKKGINNLKNLKNIGELIKEEVVSGFKFGLETKRDKETFTSRKLLNPKNLFSPKSSSTLISESII